MFTGALTGVLIATAITAAFGAQPKQSIIPQKTPVNFTKIAIKGDITENAKYFKMRDIDEETAGKFLFSDEEAGYKMKILKPEDDNFEGKILYKKKMGDHQADGVKILIKTENDTTLYSTDGETWGEAAPEGIALDAITLEDVKATFKK